MTRLFIAARLALLVAGAFLSGLVGPQASPAAANPPNVLIIVTDDQRIGTLGVMPHTVRFFKRGGRTFTRGFVTTPLCCPSRSSIFTGLYAHNHGVLGNNGGHALPQSITVQRQLHDAGYWTAMVGKYLNGWPLDRNPPNFDHWAVSKGPYIDPEFNIDGNVRRVRGYSTDVVASRAVHLLRGFEGADSRPWFLYLAPKAPHLPSTPAAKYAGAHVPPWRWSPAVFETDRSDKPQWVQQSLASRTETASTRADQLRTLMSADDLVGRLSRTLGNLGERRRTIAFFLSDNGFLWGEHGLWRKGQPYTDSIKVPLLMRWPGHVARGSRERRFVANIDLAPTILDAAGITPSSPMDGRSLLRAWPRRRLFTEYFGGLGVPDWASVRTKWMQYVEYYDAQRSHVTFREYYRLDHDRWELKNLLRDGNRANNPDVGRLHRLVKSYGACAGSSCP